MLSSRTLRLLVVGAFFVAATAACDGCGGCSDDDAADARLTELGAFIPANADGAVVVPQIETLPETIDYAVEHISQFPPDARAYEALFSRELGIELTELESWEESGFDTEGSLMISAVGSRPVLTAHVDDEETFEESVIGHFRDRLDDDSIDQETFGDRTFQVAGQNPPKDLAWFFDDSRVILVMPPYDVFDIYETGSATSVANKLGGLDPEVSLAESEAFAEFRRGITDDFPLGVYVHVGQQLEDEDIDDDALGVTGVETFVDAMMDWTQSNAEGAGVGLRADDQRLEFRAFVGGDDEVIEEARKAYRSDEQVDWGGLLTEHTVVGGRTSFDLQRAVDTYLETLSDDDRRMIRREFQQISDEIGIYIEDDVIPAFSGHSLLAFYGVGGDIDSVVTHVLSGRIDRAVIGLFANMGLLVSFHFSDADKMTDLAQMAQEKAGDTFRRDALNYQGDPIDDVEIFEPFDTDAFPFRFALQDDTLTVSTAGIGEEAIYEYLTDERDESALADLDDAPLGAEFADSETTNGLYVNFSNLRSTMRNIAMLAGSANTIRALHEMLIVADVEDDGFYLDATVQFSDSLDD